MTSGGEGGLYLLEILSEYLYSKVEFLKKYIEYIYFLIFLLILRRREVLVNIIRIFND